MLLVLSSLCFAVETSVSSFTGQSNPFNVTFDSNSNYNFLIDIPMYFYIKNISINFSNGVNNLSSICFQESPLISTFCGGLNTGKEDNGLGSWDDGSYTSCEIISGDSRVVNYSKPNASNINLNSLTWNINGNGCNGECDTKGNFNLSIPYDCFNFYNNKVSLMAYQSNFIGNKYNDVYSCWNGTWKELSNINYSATTGLCEVSAYWNVSGVRLANFSLYLNNVLQNNFTTFNSNTIFLNTTLSNKLLSTLQPINITFHSDTAGILEINLLNATYAYGIDTCTNSFKIPSNATALNLTYYDTASNLINVQHESTTFYLDNISYSSASLNQLSFCVYPNWANIPQDTQFLYTYNTIGYNYFLSNNFSNDTQILKLYTNNGTTQVLFNVLDLDGNALAGYQIQVLQYNVGTGTYTTTEILQTDSNGRSLGNIVLNTAYYNFIVYDTNNNVVSTLTGIRVTSTTYTITVTGEADEYYTDLQNSLGIVSTTYFNNDTNNFVFTWSDATGGMHLACLRVINKTYLGATVMTDICTQSAAGTIIYNINPKNDTSYMATSYLKYDYEFPLANVGFALPDLTKLFNVDSQNGLFIGTLLVIVGILIAMPNAVLGIVYFSLAFMINFLLGIFKFVDTSTSIGIGVLSSIILLGLVIIYIGGRQQS